MTNESDRCPKCDGELEEGFVVESRGANCFADTWIEGPPEHSGWAITKVRGKNARWVTTYRCVGCGYLESFATQQCNGPFPTDVG